MVFGGWWATSTAGCRNETAGSLLFAWGVPFAFANSKPDLANVVADLFAPAAPKKNSKAVNSVTDRSARSAMLGPPFVRRVLGKREAAKAKLQENFSNSPKSKY